MHHRSGIGDLVWHIPYFRAIAGASAGGRVTVIARPSCRATDILAADPCVERVIEYDRRPRATERRRGAHDGIAGTLRFAAALRRERFERVYIFGGRARYALIALLAGIPERAGFGFTALERALLNRPPFIARFAGEGSWVYPEATAFAIAQGLAGAPLLPRMAVPPRLVAEAAGALGPAVRARVALAIGSSEPRKQWGAQRFAELAAALARRGYPVLLLGGPAESALAETIRASVPVAERARLSMLTQPSVLRSAAYLRCCALCVANDTGMLNVAAACEVPAIGLFGATRALAHDPLIAAVQAESMAAIGVAEVLARVEARLSEPPR